jgi:HK97 family phage major capsid protein
VARRRASYPDRSLRRRRCLDADSIAFPHLTSDAAAAWVSAGADITAADPGGETVTVIPQKLAALITAHNEVLADANPDALDTLAKSLIRSLALKFDVGAFEGSGTAPQPRGLKNVAGIGTVSLGTNGAALTNLDPFADAIGALETANASAGAIVMHPRTWQAASKLKEATGSSKPLLQESAGSAGQGIQRSIYGVPVFLSSQVSIADTQGSGTNLSSAYVYDPSEVYAVIRQDVRVERDSSRLFNSDQSELRAIMRAAVTVPNPTAVVRITGIV